MSTDSLNSGRRRRTYTAQFKADMVAQCLQGDVSLASLAVDHGMNPNVLHRWVLEHERYGKHSLPDDGDAALVAQTRDMSPANWIRVDQIWLAVEPMDMRAGPDTALARVVKDFGAAHPHHAYVFANKRVNRMKILVHDGLGVWLAARRLNQGRFVWPRPGQIHVELSHEQLQALVIGLPWHRVGDAGIIDVI